MRNAVLALISFSCIGTATAQVTVTGDDRFIKAEAEVPGYPGDEQHEEASFPDSFSFGYVTAFDGQIDGPTASADSSQDSSYFTDPFDYTIVWGCHVVGLAEASLDRVTAGGSWARATNRYIVQFRADTHQDMTISGSAAGSESPGPNTVTEIEFEYTIWQKISGTSAFRHRGRFVYPFPNFEDDVYSFAFEDRLLRLAPGDYEIEIIPVVTATRSSPNGTQTWCDVWAGYEFDASWEPVACLADFNRDGIVDTWDYLDFIAAMDEPDQSTSSGTWHDLMEADIDGSGTVDYFDYLDFIALYNEGCG